MVFVCALQHFSLLIPVFLALVAGILCALVFTLFVSCYCLLHFCSFPVL